MSTEMWDAIAGAYSPVEANRCLNWANNRDTLRAIGGIAYEVQDQLKKRPGQCRYWTALWVKRVRAELDVPAVQVRGDLFAYGECVYRCPDGAEFLDPQNAEFEQRWPGHSWLALGHLIADISLTLTAVLDENCQLTLKRAVDAHFRDNKGLIRVPAFTAEGFQKRDLLYVPQGVYTDAAIERHIEVGRLSDESLAQ